MALLPMSIGKLKVGANANTAPKIVETTDVAASTVTQETTITFVKGDVGDVYTVTIGGKTYTYANDCCY